MKKVSKLITGASCQETIADSFYILLLLMMLRDRLKNCGLKLWSCQDTEEQVERGAISGRRTFPVILILNGFQTDCSVDSFGEKDDASSLVYSKIHPVPLARWRNTSDPTFWRP